MNVTGKVFNSIKKHYEKLTATDRRIAGILSEDPEFVAFGTVAEVAARAETSGPSVVRLAEKLGYSGFVGIQTAVRDDLSQYLPSSLNRISQTKAGNSIERVMAVEMHNVEATLSKIDDSALQAFIKKFSEIERQVFILASDQCRGSADTFADLLTVVRPGVQQLHGSEYKISSHLIEARPKDILLCMDFERHERWLIASQQRAKQHGLYSVAISNNPLSSLAINSDLHFFASATAPGPFDSNTGLNALLNLFIEQLSEYDKQRVGKRLKKIHKQWQKDDVLE